MSPRPDTPARMSTQELYEYLKREIPPGISVQQINLHIRNAKLKRDTKTRVNVVEFMEAYMAARARSNSARAGAGSPQGQAEGQDPRRYKTVLECMILKIKHDQLKGQLISVDDHLAEVREIFGWMRDVFAQWISEVKVLTGDARVVKESERLRDKALGRMQERCKNAEAKA